MRSEKKTIGVGIVGFGLARAVLHAPLTDVVDGLRIVAVASSRSDELARRMPGVRSVADHRAGVACQHRTLACCRGKARRQRRALTLVLCRTLRRDADVCIGLSLRRVRVERLA